MRTVRVPGCVRRPCERCLQPCIHLLLQPFTRAAEAGSQEGSPAVGSAQNRTPAGGSRGLSALAWRNTGGCRRQGDWVQAPQELPSEAK